MFSENLVIAGKGKRSLRFRIISMLLAGAAGMLLLSMVYSYLSQRQQLQDDLNREADSIVNRLAVTMAQPLWNFDQQNLEGLVLQELKDPAVLSALVTANMPELLSLGRKKNGVDQAGTQQFIPFSTHVDERSGTHHRERLIQYNNQTIGSVHVTLTDQPVRNKLTSLILQQTLQALIILTGLTLLTYLGLSRLLFKPLYELRQTVEEYGNGNLSARTALCSDDEIGVLGSTLNKMAAQVSEKISEIEASKSALKESEAFRRLVFESSILPITIIDLETRLFIDANQAALEANGLSSLEELRGKSILDVSAPQQYDGTPSARMAENFHQQVLQHGRLVVDWRHQRPDGEQWDGEVHLVCFSMGSHQLAQATTLDVTERKRSAALMVQTEKMMMVGGLAAGMAHEINNPLGIITQTVQNIQRRFDPHLPSNQAVANEYGLNLDSLQGYLEARQIFSFIKSIRDATERAARIISNMLKFSRKSESHTEYVELGLLFDQVLELAASDYDLKKNYDFKRVAIVQDNAPGLPKVPVSALEIEQVLLNLLKNATQAMYDAGTQNPQIVLRTLGEQEYAVIEVSDNGPGMAPEVKKRVFEPFYTTKSVGQGTGLGLSVSYSIITNNHKGTIEVESRPGQGTCFRIRLPLRRGNGARQGVCA